MPNPQVNGKHICHNVIQQSLNAATKFAVCLSCHLHAVNITFCRVAYEKDPRVLDAGTFTVQREDHTLGNLIRV